MSHHLHIPKTPGYVKLWSFCETLDAFVSLLSEKLNSRFMGLPQTICAVLVPSCAILCVVFVWGSITVGHFHNSIQN